MAVPPAVLLSGLGAPTQGGMLLLGPVLGSTAPGSAPAVWGQPGLCGAVLVPRAGETVKSIQNALKVPA